MQTSDELILSIDIGTQSVRAVAIDLMGNIIDLYKQHIEPYFSVKPGWAEQHPEYFYEQLCIATQQLWIKNPDLKPRITAVTLTTQRGTVVNLDENGNSLRPAIHWLDQRLARLEGFPPRWMKQGLKFLDLYEMMVYAIQQAECNWIRQEQPEIWEKTHKFMLLSGFIVHRLTGEFADSIGNTVAYLPFDYKRQQWATGFHLNKIMFKVPPEKLCRLVKPSDQISIITEKASKETGIPAGLPLIAAAADKANEVLGSGCHTPDIACVSYGTTATLQTTHSKFIEVVPFVPPYPSAIPGYYNTEVMIFRGYWMISWFKKEFGHREIELAKQMGVEPEALFDEMINTIPPGSMGLMLQPYWTPGIRTPGIEAKGAIIGFGDVHTRAHIYRAILEGLAYALKDGLNKTQRKTGIKISKIRVSGGGSQSKNAMQLTADIFDLTAEKPHTYETSALGAAINAAVGMKYYSGFDDAIQHMTRLSESYSPIPANRDIYKKLFDKVYLKIYKKLQPLYDEIRTITDYPKLIK